MVDHFYWMWVTKRRGKVKAERKGDAKGSKKAAAREDELRYEAWDLIKTL